MHLQENRPLMSLVKFRTWLPVGKRKGRSGNRVRGRKGNENSKDSVGVGYW